MRELIRSADPILLTLATDRLAAEGIPAFELDRHMSNFYGGAGMILRRLMVADRDHFRATAILREHGLLDG